MADGQPGHINNRVLGPLTEDELISLERWARQVREREEQGKPEIPADALSEVRSRAFTVLCLIENICALQSTVDDVEAAMHAYRKQAEKPRSDPRVSARRLYAFTLHPEPDASPAIARLLRSLGSCRMEDEFAAEDFRRFRDGLSAAGVQLLEAETWIESAHEAVL